MLLETEDARPGQTGAGAATVIPGRVIKRDGREVRFDLGRIRSAIQRAGVATGEFGEDEAERLAGQVLKVLSHRSLGMEPTVEQIQDVVEQVLITGDHFRTARAYIVYREQHKIGRAHV